MTSPSKTRARKQRLLALARSAGVLPLLEPLRYLRSMVECAGENRRFLAAHPGFAAPPSWWMHDMYRHVSFETYWRTGGETAATISAIVDAHVGAKEPRIADWGCGLARVVQRLPERYRRTGFDYNKAAIDWCRNHVAGVEFRPNALMPPLPADDGFFDALYALSVFTHLSEASHFAWISEIERVLAPGGIFIGAFHAKPHTDQLLPEEQSRFDAGRLVVRAGTKEGSRIFVAYQPERWVRKTLLKNFTFLEDPRELFGQTIFVARRR